MKISTYNVNGFKTYWKKGKVLELFKLKEIDIVLLQETHIGCKSEIEEIEKVWGGKTFWSFSKSNESTGVGILINSKIETEIISFQYDVEGRIVLLDFKLNNLEYRIINVYAPNNTRERKLLFQNIQPYLVTRKILILAGDFNCVENIDLDKSGGNKEYGTQGSEILKEIKNDFDLLDPFRKLNPLEKCYSWFEETKGIKERLDRFYISKRMLNNVSSINHDKFSFSDHSIVTLSLKDNKNNIGKGYWKCNTSALNDPNFIDSFCVMWNGLVLRANNNFSIEWWDNCKETFKSHIIEFCRIKGQRFKAELRKLEEKIRMFNDFNKIEPGRFNNDIEMAQNEIEELLHQKINGAIIRSKAQILDNNEKPSKFFLKKEHARAKSKLIDKLETESGIVTENEEVIDECKKYYTNLYKEEEIDDNLTDYFMREVPKLNDIDKDICEGLITKEECLNSLNKMQNGKSPGSDGLPKEFYVKVFPIIGDVFVQVINNSFTNGLLSNTQRYGLITLICKKPEESEKLTNWRPISLLNVDYKIISKTLTNRLSSVIGKLVEIDQTCSVPGRSILDNIHLIRNAIDYVEQKDLECILLSLDQSKAFDRVSHKYMFKALKAYGFGDNFINWIKILYNNIESSVIVNGHISNSFNVERSVRQGCSLSPLLYVLCIEPFAIKIRKDNHIKGLKLPGTDKTATISQYADDTSNIVMDTQSISKILVLSELYSLASGALLNKNKSCAMWLGKWKNRDDELYGLTWVKSMKICGVHFGENSESKNWNSIIDKMAKTSNLFKSRVVSILGKATICNIMLCSKLWYTTSVLNIPPLYLEKVIKTVFSFIWSGKTELVKRKTLYLSKEKGGIELTHVDTKVKAFQIKHVFKLINGEYAKWQSLAIYWIGHSLRKYNPEYGSNLIPHSDQMTPFYVSCMEQFRKYSVIKDGKIEPIGITTKIIYSNILEIANDKVIPQVFSVYPNIDFYKAWSINLNDILSPMQRDLSWRILHNVVPVLSNLHRMHISQSNACPFCKGVETLIHAFYTCSIIKPLWAELIKFIQLMGITVSEAILNCLNTTTIKTVVFNQFPVKKVSKMNDKLVLYLINELKYVIWQKRCQRLKENKISTTNSILMHFLKCVRSRIRTDFYRFNDIRFNEFWGKFPNMVTIVDNQLYFNF